MDGGSHHARAVSTASSPGIETPATAVLRFSESDRTVGTLGLRLSPLAPNLVHLAPGSRLRLLR